MSARRSRTRVATLIVVIFTAACAHGGRAEQPVSDVPTTTRAPHVRTTPMVLETALPRRIPTVDVTARASGRRVTQHGVRYTTDFPVRGATTYQAPHWPVAWPAPMATGLGDVTVTLHTGAVPDDVTLKSWRRLIPDGHGVPETHLAGPAFECHRFDAPRCDLSGDGTTLQIVVPSRALAGPYIAVVVEWHIPHAQQTTGPLASDTASATWIFRLDRGTRVGASDS